MSNASKSNQAHLVAAVVAEFQFLHQELRLEVARRGDESLNWVPCRGANSIATIVTHTLGSEAETFRAVAGVPAGRNRDAEFQMGIQTQADLLDQIDHANSLIEDLARNLSDVRALALTTLPTLSDDDQRTGLTWLIRNLGHAREHMGHLRLTGQLYDASPNPLSEATRRTDGSTDNAALELDLTAQPAEEDIRLLEAGLERFNRAAPLGADRTKVPLAVWLRRKGRLLGGAYGDTHYGWLYLSMLWIDETQRGRGWGRRLIERFEAEAVTRGCRASWVDTYGFQAPGFYEKLGYREFGRLEDFPPGSARSFYWKPLH
jgi:ribosomal protein S18 acetylase RimI-like enzyme